MKLFQPYPCPLSKIREPINQAPSFFKNRDALKKTDVIVRSKKQERLENQARLSKNTGQNGS